MLASETLDLYIRWIKLSNSLIIKLDPLMVTFSYVAEIVSEVSSSIMHDNPPQFISKLIIFLRYSLLFGKSIIINIEFMRELPS